MDQTPSSLAASRRTQLGWLLTLLVLGVVAAIHTAQCAPAMMTPVGVVHTAPAAERAATPPPVSLAVEALKTVLVSAAAPSLSTDLPGSDHDSRGSLAACLLLLVVAAAGAAMRVDTQHRRRPTSLGLPDTVCLGTEIPPERVVPRT